MGDEYPAIDVQAATWQTKATQLAMLGLPFVIQNFTYSNNSAAFDLVEKIATQNGLKSSFNLADKKAVFERHRP